MASGWVKSLHCKSRAFEDVYHPNPRNILTGSSCRKTTQSIKDVIETTTKIQKTRKRSTKPDSPAFRRPVKPESESTLPVRSRQSVTSRLTRNPDPVLPALKELPEGHPSRNVVEIIFHTSWIAKAFTGRVEMIFKVQKGSRTVSGFEEYREMVKAKSGSGSPKNGDTWEEDERCIADGNEMMRFHCLGPTSCGGVGGGGGGGNGLHDSWAFPGGKGTSSTSIFTFSDGSLAHESGGGGKGRRAMLVCRVIAGRVWKQTGFDALFDMRVGFDSVSGDNNELLVSDPRAVLPCFLIIYKL